MVSTESFCKIVAGNQTYYLLTSETLRRNEFEAFDLALSDGTFAWIGSVSADDLEGFGGKVHMEYDDIVDQTRKALTRQNLGSMSFQYHVKTTGDQVQFSWKKSIDTENIKFQLGSIALQQKTDSSEIFQSIFEHIISLSSELNDEIKHLKSDNERLVNERALAGKRLEKYVAAKEEIENDLFTKFVVVLNDKKSKIRDLRDQVGGNQSGSRSANNVGVSHSRSELVTQSDDETDAQSEDQNDPETKIKREYDSEFDTDEEDKTVVQAERTKTSRQDTSMDSSLMLDDDEDDSPVTSRRRRQRAASGKRQTPSKPVIPRVPSSDKKPTASTSKHSSRKVSLKKSKSTSSRSSDNIGADDLVDMV